MFLRSIYDDYLYAKSIFTLTIVLYIRVINASYSDSLIVNHPSSDLELELCSKLFDCCLVLLDFSSDLILNIFFPGFGYEILSGIS